MSVRILWDPSENVAALYDSVTGALLGRVFDGDESYEDAEHFLDWLTRWGSHDPRALAPTQLAELRETFFRERPAAA